jgi:hypothetical protein
MSDSTIAFYQLRSDEQKRKQIKRKNTKVDSMVMQSFRFFHYEVLNKRYTMDYDQIFQEVTKDKLPGFVYHKRRHPSSFKNAKSQLKFNCTYWDQLLRDNSPIRVEYDSKYNGFKVLATRRTSFREVKEYLTGYALEISPEDALLYRELGHSSLIESPITKIGIPMIGLLKFVNHHCDSQLTYKYKQSRDNEGHSIPMTENIQGQDFYVITISHSMGYIDAEIPGYRRDEEIFVNYGNEKHDFVCICNSNTCFSRISKRNYKNNK